MLILGSERENKTKENTAVALGFFDGLHKGHISVINRVLNIPKLEPAVFTFSNMSALPKFSSLELIQTEELKHEMLVNLGIKYLYSPDFETVRSYTAEQFIKEIIIDKFNAQTVVCGDDFRFGKGGNATAYNMEKILEPFGIKAIIVPQLLNHEKPISSTQIRELIKSGNIKQANFLLGHEFTFYLEVIHGNQIGRTINSPTINQQIPKNHIVPKFGVYVSETVIATKTYISITNIGIKPTVGGQAFPLAETHILGFNGDLYGKKVKIKLLDFVRAERQFSSIEELKNQIQLDALKAINYKKEL